MALDSFRITHKKNVYIFNFFIPEIYRKEGYIKNFDIRMPYTLVFSIVERRKYSIKSLTENVECILK